MISKRFLEKMDATEFEKNVFKSYLKQRDEHLIKSNTSVVLDDDNLKYLKKLAQTHKCSLTDVINIILKEKIIQLEEEIFKEKLLIIDSFDLSKNNN